MNENHTLSIQGKIWKAPLRILTLITFFIGAYTFVQSILVFVQDLEQANLSMLVVTLYLLVTPLFFAASFFFAFAIHKMSSGEGADKQLVFGFSLAVLAAVDNLIYVSIRHEGDLVSFYLLGGIELICFIICFLYFQGMGNKAMAICAAGLLVACFGLNMIEAIRYFVSIDILDFTGYYFTQSLLALLIGAESLVFVLGIETGFSIKKEK